MLGFQFLSNFVRTFHRVIGCSPAPTATNRPPPGATRRDYVIGRITDRPAGGRSCIPDGRGYSGESKSFLLAARFVFGVDPRCPGFVRLCFATSPRTLATNS